MMIDILGYLCAAGAVLAGWIGGSVTARDGDWLPLFGWLGATCVLVGASISLLQPSSPIPLALISLAILAAMSMNQWQSDDGDTEGDPHGG